ncbi:hypothetical protein JW933_07310, partial [candidate division FCPU426 bacterium]|nr:hypothetical protein [candidate division FCPU426 bacterium]
MPRHLLWAPVLVAVGILSAAASLQEAQEQLKTYQQNIRQEKKDLENVRERLRREKQAVRRQKQKERSVLFEIQRLGKKLEEADERYQDDQENLRLVRNRIAHLRYEVQGTETELARLREFLAARLRMIYRERQIGFWKMLVTSQSLSQALSRLKFFHVLAEQNAYLIKTVAHKRRQLLVSTQKLMIQEQKAEELEQASKHSLEKLQATQQERESYLHRVRVMRTEHEQALKELDQASRRLSALINKLEQRRRTLQRKLTQYGQGFARRRGTLPWPTRGRVV